MSATQLKWVVAMLVVAVLLWVVSEATSSRPDDRQTGRVMPEIVEGVDRIVITSDDGTILLSRTGAEWTVNDFDISNSHLATLFTGLGDTLEYEIVARSSGVHARMGVDETGTSFMFFRGNQQVDHVIFGKRGSHPATIFARRDGEDAVYRYAGPLTELVDLSVEDWRDHVVVDAMPESIGRVTVERGTSRYDLERRPDGWVLAPDIPVDSTVVNRVLRSFRPMEAKGFASEAQLDSVDFQRPERRVTLVDTAGDTVVALAFDSTDARFWVRSNRGPTVYALPHRMTDQATPLRDIFFPDE